MLSLILTHLILAAHRKIITAEKGVNYNPQNAVKQKEKKPLCSLSFSRGTKQVIGATLITILLLLSLSLLAVGSIWNSFEFQFQGAAALALSYLSQPVTTAYSLISLGLKLPDASPDPFSFGIRFIQVTFFIYGIAIPLFHLLSLLLLWLLPMSRKSQRNIYVLTEILNAWSAIDVFVISVIAALLEISQFAQFIIGDRCDTINYYLAEYMNDALQGVDKCFNVLTKLDTGCWLLFGGCIAYIVSSIIVMRACHSALSRREKDEQQQNDNTIEKEPEPDLPAIQ